MDLFLLGFLHFIEEVEHFGEKVLPLVRELEADLASRNGVGAEFARNERDHRLAQALEAGVGA